MSVNEEFLNVVLHELIYKTSAKKEKRSVSVGDAIEAKKTAEAILQHFQQEQEKGSIKEIADTLNGSGSHACYCPRSVDGGCKCALKDEYLVPYAKVDGKKPYYTQLEVDRLIREAKEELLDEMLEEANEVPHDEFYERALNWSSVKAFILSYYDRLTDESKHKEGGK